MKTVFKAITNIAEDIQSNLFENFDKFLSGIDKNRIEEGVHNYCAKLIFNECKKVEEIHGILGKHNHEYNTLNENGKYKISYVDIDNIELLDVDFSLGTIFGIYENSFSSSSLVASLYITYGPRFQLVFAYENETVCYSYKDGRFVKQENLVLENKGKINSTAGIASEWSDEHKLLIDGFFDKGYRLRFSDSLSLDTHQILFKKGGLYSSPATKSYPNGKLETIFEAFPVAYIIEKAGGEAINLAGRVLDSKNVKIEDKTPLYFGSKEEIKIVKNSHV